RSRYARLHVRPASRPGVSAYQRPRRRPDRPSVTPPRAGSAFATTDDAPGPMPPRGRRAAPHPRAGRGELLQTGRVTVAGPGAAKMTVSGNNSRRVFAIAAEHKGTVRALGSFAGRPCMKF